jgi:hypothetical protein
VFQFDGPPKLDFLVDEPKLSLGGRLELTRPDAGHYVLGDGIHYIDMGLTTPDGSFGASGADYAPEHARGSVQLELAAPLPAKVYFEPHGTFTATLLSNSGGPPADLHIEF